jgi:hypothetical protein
MSEKEVKNINIKWVRQKISSEEYEYSGHAEKEREADKISLEDVEHAIFIGEIIEEYPDDPRGESCLVLGYGKDNYPIHIVCGRTVSSKLRIITVYIPSLPKWLDERTRRRK